MSDDDNTTESTETRWEYVATVLAIVIVASLPLFIALGGAGVLTLTSVPKLFVELYVLIVTVAATWTFGSDVLEAVRK